MRYKTELSNRNKAETGIRYEWYALQRWGANYSDDFFKQKIVWKRIGSIIRFSYDELGHFTLDSTCFATGKSLKYLTAILNSKMGNYLLKNSPKTGTGDLIISVQAVVPIYVPKASEAEQNVIEELIDRLLLSKDEQAIKIETEIDLLVFKLYKLNVDEIKFVALQ